MKSIFVDALPIVQLSIDHRANRFACRRAELASLDNDAAVRATTETNIFQNLESMPPSTTFSLTLANDAGDMTEKQTRNTSVCG
jgi:hypothetical protein